MSKFAAYLNAALALAWLALFFTNDALFVSHEVDLSDHLRGDAFAMAWAGSAICSRLYIALVNYGVELRHATAIFCLPSIVVGTLAALQIQSFTSLAWAMPLLDLKILANALQGKLKVGGVIHVLYTIAGVALFMTGESPVLQPGVAFLGDKFRMVSAARRARGLSTEDEGEDRVAHTHGLTEPLRFFRRVISGAIKTGFSHQKIACGIFTSELDPSLVKLGHRHPKVRSLALA